MYVVLVGCPPRLQAIAGLGSFRFSLSGWRGRFRSPDVSVTSVTAEMDRWTDGADAGVSAESVVWARASVSPGSALISGLAESIQRMRARCRCKGVRGARVRKWNCQNQVSNVVGSSRRHSPGDENRAPSEGGWGACWPAFRSCKRVVLEICLCFCLRAAT